MKTLVKSFSYIVAAILVVSLIAFGAIVYSGSSMAVDIDGNTVTGVAGAGYVFAGVIVAVISVILTGLLVSLILAGVSIFLVGLFGVLFAGGFLLVAPMFLPLAFIIFLGWLMFRKKPVAPAATNVPSNT